MTAFAEGVAEMNEAIRARTVIAASVTGLLLLLLLGGASLALVENTSYLDGVWLAFCVISTTGFGDGPRTSGGIVLSMIVFAFAAVAWFGVLLTAVETGFRRAGTGPQHPNVFRFAPNRSTRLRREL
jgi:Ion channel